jgi:prephenate dehydrogenase
MTKPAFHKIVVFGVGLIGGSFAMALRKARAVDTVVGFGRSKLPLAQSLQLGVIDRIGKDVAVELGDADLVMLATPVGQMAELMTRISPHIGTRTLVTDCGSTKSDVVSEAYARMGEKVAQFVPAHPIAGAEQSGATAARNDLFQWKKVVLTPLPENSAESVARVRQAWELCGAMVNELTPAQHDEIFAAVSHLPHLLAFALVHVIAQRDDRDLLLSFAASGFRDFTRIAASSPEMWRDIVLANRKNLSRALESFTVGLQAFRLALKAGDALAVAEFFEQARERREQWVKRAGSRSPE